VGGFELFWGCVIVTNELKNESMGILELEFGGID